MPPLQVGGDAGGQDDPAAGEGAVDPLGDGLRGLHQRGGAAGRQVAGDRGEHHLRPQGARDPVGLAEAQGQEQVAGLEVVGPDVVDDAERGGHRPEHVEAHQLLGSDLAGVALPEPEAAHPDHRPSGGQR
jgi:hypothetical protein